MPLEYTARLSAPPTSSINTTVGASGHYRRMACSCTGIPRISSNSISNNNLERCTCDAHGRTRTARARAPYTAAGPRNRPSASMLVGTERTTVVAGAVKVVLTLRRRAGAACAAPPNCKHPGHLRGDCRLVRHRGPAQGISSVSIGYNTKLTYHNFTGPSIGIPRRALRLQGAADARLLCGHLLG